MEWKCYLETNIYIYIYYIWRCYIREENDWGLI